MAAATKTCKNPACPCDNPQPVVNFGWQNRAKGKRKAQCKVCISAYKKQYRLDHPEKARERHRKYHEANREAIHAQQRQYREENREAIQARMQQYREDNREEIRAQQNTPEAQALRNAANAARNATDEGKLLNAASRLHRQFYKGELKEGTERLARAEALVGCTRQQYRDYLAWKFKPGMTHGNYGRGVGTWAPDHIIPKAAFKGEINDANLEIVYWFGNVQPLWYLENARKRDYYTEEGKSNLIVNYNTWVAAGRLPHN